MLLSHERADSSVLKPEFDTFGGKMKPQDYFEFDACARRELKEEVKLPVRWRKTIERSQTYLGIAGAMATQWMPVLLEYVAGKTQSEPSRGATDIVNDARTATVTRRAQVAFRREASHGDFETVALYGNTEEATLPIFTVEADRSPAEALKRWARERMVLPPEWRAAVDLCRKFFPNGHTTCSSKTKAE